MSFWQNKATTTLLTVEQGNFDTKQDNEERHRELVDIIFKPVQLVNRTGSTILGDPIVRSITTVNELSAYTLLFEAETTGRKKPAVHHSLILEVENEWFRLIATSMSDHPEPNEIIGETAATLLSFHCDPQNFPKEVAVERARRARAEFN